MIVRIVDDDGTVLSEEEWTYRGIDLDTLTPHVEVRVRDTSADGDLQLSTG